MNTPLRGQNGAATLPHTPQRSKLYTLVFFLASGSSTARVFFRRGPLARQDCCRCWCWCFVCCFVALVSVPLFSPVSPGWVMGQGRQGGWHETSGSHAIRLLKQQRQHQRQTTTAKKCYRRRHGREDEAYGPAIPNDRRVIRRGVRIPAGIYPFRRMRLPPRQSLVSDTVRFSSLKSYRSPA